MTKKTIVVNVKNEEYDVYIGRANKYLKEKGSFLANPFKITRQTTREQSIEKYHKWFYKQICSDPFFKKAVLTLKGRRLGCWCKPLACHGDVIVDYIENPVPRCSICYSPLNWCNDCVGWVCPNCTTPTLKDIATQ